MIHENNQHNPLLCDPVEGICGLPDDSATSASGEKPAVKKIRLIYFTDPICSSCWGIEPQLRKLKLEYGANMEIEYHMGGLLHDWSYNSGGISKPADVAQHWDEVSTYYDMPIDGDVWLEDPLHSSYPPSIAFKAAQMQNTDLALSYLRELRELVFLQKKNIASWDVIALAAKNAGLDELQLKRDFDGNALLQFEEDLKIARTYGVRGFPTLFFVNENGDQEMVYGTKPYQVYENAILKLNPKTTKAEYPKNETFLFQKFNSLTAREFAELAEYPREESEAKLNTWVDANKLSRFDTKNGSLWKLL